VPTASEVLGAFAAARRFRDLPADVRDKVRLHLLDVLGVALASASLPFARTAFDAAQRSGGAGDGTVIGFATPLPASWAAFVNGTLAHGIDYDDTHLGSVVHVSCTVAPAALAVAEEVGAGGEALLSALALGMETAIRVGLAAPAAFHDRGFHPTGICGTFGAAVSTATLRGLSAAQIVDALGLCGSMAAGSMEFLADGSWSKRMHAGWAAHGGLLAAALAQAGFRGPKAVFDGRFGLYASHLGTDGWNLAPLTQGLGERWELLGTALKPYPCCHFNHAFIDCIAALRRLHDLRPDAIERIECDVAPTAIPVVCEPVASKRAPQNDYDAKFSLPYAVASALVRGHVDVDDFTPAAIGDAAVLDVAARVQHRADPDTAFPRVFPGRVRVLLRNGRVVTHDEPVNRGSSERPLAPAEVHDKFMRNATRVLPAARAEALRAAVDNLERAGDVRELSRLLVP
jgi:2-methylcitrate dehydratase PrpD